MAVSNTQVPTKWRNCILIHVTLIPKLHYYELHLVFQQTTSPLCCGDICIQNLFASCTSFGRFSLLWDSALLAPSGLGIGDLLTPSSCNWSLLFVSALSSTTSPFALTSCDGGLTTSQTASSFAWGISSSQSSWIDASLLGWNNWGAAVLLLLGECGTGHSSLCLLLDSCCCCWSLRLLLSRIIASVVVVVVVMWLELFLSWNFRIHGWLRHIFAVYLFLKWMKTEKQSQQRINIYVFCLYKKCSFTIAAIVHENLAWHISSYFLFTPYSLHFPSHVYMQHPSSQITDRAAIVSHKIQNSSWIR